MRGTIMIAGAVLALAGCTSVGGPGVSTYYDCGGARLKVDYGPRGALIAVSGQRPLLFKRVNSVAGAVYERKAQRFEEQGGGATWTVGRMMPQRCSRVIVPR